jgi:hypothetical protein
MAAMSILYTEKGRWLHEAIADAGLTLWRENGVWMTDSNEAAVQAFIDAFDPLPYVKDEKKTELKAEGLMRIQAIMPAISDFDMLEFMREFWLSIAPAARSPTTSFTQIIDIYQAGRDAIAVINGLGTVSAVLAYDVVNDPSWP